MSGSCNSTEPATAVMLAIDADTKAKMLGEGLQIDIEGRSSDNHFDGMPISRAFRPKESGQPTWPLSLSITPRGGDALRTFLVTATLSDSKGAIAVLRARSGFVSQHTITLPLFFSDDCLNKASLDCGETETCFQGDCVDAFIDAKELPPWHPDDAPAADGGIDSMSSSMSDPVTGAGGTGGASGRKAAGTSGSPSKPGDNMQASGGAGGSASADAGVMHISTAPGDCGDGMVNPGEKCDTGIPAGEDGACPESCPAEDGCHPATLEGSGCQTACMAYAITTVESGDGCCPPGTDAKDDTDCGALCGNNVQENGELCDPPETCPTPESCVAQDPCLVATYTGDPSTCNANCDMRPITECVAGDRCCPSECTRANDSDCSGTCGNGTLDPGELCEAGTSRPCPTTCADSNVCTSDWTLGSPKNCNVVCANVAITAAFPLDQCCPSGANANSDSDCQAKCGNGIVEGAERCDGKCPTKADCDDKNPCTNDDIEGAASSCNVRCIHTQINTASKTSDMCCPRGANANNDVDCTPVCGNGVTETGEECDGRDCMSCDDGDKCTTDSRVAGCKMACAHTPIPNCCPQGQTACGATCVDTMSDKNNCGGCGKVCGTTCTAGVCAPAMPTCTPQQELCNGACVNTKGSDTNNCGGCGTHCGTTCTAGVCGPATPTCTPQQELCSGTCINTKGNDENNCGGCGTHCSTTCAAGICAPATPTCTPQQELCSGACINTKGGDTNNCGGCGTHCDTTCSGGICEAAPPKIPEAGAAAPSRE